MGQAVAFIKGGITDPCEGVRNRNLGKIGAIFESARSDRSNTIRNNKARQAGAPSESLLTETVFGDAVWNGDACQVDTTCKGLPQNLGDAIRDHIRTAAFRSRVRNNQRFILVEKNPVFTGKRRAFILHINAREAAATVESLKPDKGNTCWKRDVRQAGAVREGSSANTGNAIRNRDACQVAATVESCVPDAGDSTRNRDACQAAATEESPPAKPLD